MTSKNNETKYMFTYFLFLGIFGLSLLQGCSSQPSEQSIQTAIAETQNSQLQTKTTPLPIATIFDERQQIIDTSVLLLDQKKYQDVYNLIKEQFDKGKYRRDEEVSALLDFANSMDYITDGAGFGMESVFDGISPDYNGVYHQQISDTVLSFITREDWEKRYQENKAMMDPYYATQDAISLTPVPAIGMTAEQVLHSQWGSPIDINKTTTAYGTSEQWIYPNNKYIYLENGIVVSIQE